jgi:hypothetical protein
VPKVPVEKLNWVKSAATRPSCEIVFHRVVPPLNVGPEIAPRKHSILLDQRPERVRKRRIWIHGNVRDDLFVHGCIDGTDHALDLRIITESTVDEPNRSKIQRDGKPHLNLQRLSRMAAIGALFQGDFIFGIALEDRSLGIMGKLKSLVREID